jgi:L-amino acid N-acyltransferase YncA
MEPQPPSSVCAIRPAETADVTAIADIYSDAVLNSTATFDVEPWTPERRDQWFSEHSHPYAVLVAVRGGGVVGWAALSPFQRKPAYRFAGETSLYVRAEHRAEGIGALLLARLLETAVTNGFHGVFARIVGDNPASLRLHHRFGFRRVGVEREVGYKFDRWLDVIVMQKLLAG